MGDPALRTKLATAEDLAALPDDVHAEVIQGVLVEKSAQNFAHGDAQSGVSAILKPPFQYGSGGPGGWWIISDIVVEFETHEVYRPDVVGWRRERVPERPAGPRVRIRPDWVAEVLSPSNARNDLGPKTQTYSRAGVPHYWIIDPEHETLTVLRWSQDGYVVRLIAERSGRVRAEPFEEIEIEIAWLFGYSLR